VSASLVYELPFGAGKRYLNQPSPARFLLGGWQLTSIASAHTGFPVNVTIDRSSSAVPDGNTNNQRPDLVSGVSLSPPGGLKTSEWINPAAFAIPIPGTFGDAPRNVARGPGAWQIDFGVGKNVFSSEAWRLQFRAEAFNVFNHPQYGLPQANFSSAPGVFGSIISTVNSGPVGTGTPRQLQFALRLGF
jgi:hypothetical protein